MAASDPSKESSLPLVFSRRWLALSTSVPLAAFTLLHVILYARLASQGLLGRAPAWLSSTLYVAVELLLIWLPLTFHSAYGVWLVIQQQKSRAELPLLIKLSRVSALLALSFIAYHFVHFRVPLLSGSLTSDDITQTLYAELSSTSSGIPVHAICHIAGLAATAFHLAVGFYSYGTDVGGASRQQVSKHRTLAAAALGVGLFITGSAAVIRIAAGSLLP